MIGDPLLDRPLRSRIQAAVEAPAPMVSPDQEHGKRSTVPAPEQLMCGAEDRTFNRSFFLRCTQPKWHAGPHKNDVYTWEQT